MRGLVLIVDDERDLAVACERLLMRDGWRVTTVDGRQAALAALTTDAPPALAIVDRQLPDGDGLDVVRAARAQGTPVIVMSARTSHANRAQTLEGGAAGFLAKPFSAKDFMYLVRSVAGELPRA